MSDPLVDIGLLALQLAGFCCAVVVLWYVVWTFFFSKINGFVRFVGFLRTEFAQWRRKRAAAAARLAAQKEQEQQRPPANAVGAGDQSGARSSVAADAAGARRPGGGAGGGLGASQDTERSVPKPPRPVFGMKPRETTVLAA